MQRSSRPGGSMPQRPAGASCIPLVRCTARIVLGTALLTAACARPLRVSGERPAARAPKPAPPPVRFAGSPDPLVTPPERLASSLCREVDPGPPLLRRLTRFEYNNTVADVLGDR